MNVIKRNGKMEEFKMEKIENAIQRAFEDCETDYDESLLEPIKEVLDNKYTSCVAVEQIQDTIENVLMDKNHHDVAKSYILYREKRRQIREKHARLYEESQETIKAILDCKGVENSNANVDESSFSGKNSKITSHFLKEYALDNLIDKKVADAHRNGILYTHDLDNYCTGMHNCINIDFTELFDENGGFSTRNGDVRKPNSIMSFFQLVAVTFQCQSQVQFGGVGCTKIDYDGAPYVAITFKKAFKDALIDLHDFNEDVAQSIVDDLGDDCKLESELLLNRYPDEYRVAKRHTINQTKQGAESLYHNLNTLESRAGSQVPFTSINFGTDTSPEGRLVTKCLLEASINGIGKFGRTSIFPISIFKYKKGINDKPGTPNYDLKQLALKSLSKRIYPNFVNVDISHQTEKPTCPDEEHSTMGCRTALGYDVNGLGWKRGGRGNVAPVTMNLVELGIKNGICLGERNVPDLDGFWRDLKDLLKLAETALLDRFEWICQQKAQSGYFMYHNGIMRNTLDRHLEDYETVRECMKHSTLAIGYIGIAEMCKALFGKHHAEDAAVYEFAYRVVKIINKRAKQLTEKHNLNFSCYATPAESTCMTLRNKLAERYGIIEGITDREYITNSHHVPVYYPIVSHKKIELEAPFSKLATGGYICYIELESTFVKNTKAVERLIDYAMENDVAYFAINFPIDTCGNCGHQNEIPNECPICGSNNIERLRRVTGYLTTDYSKFNKGKIAEVGDRVKHDGGAFDNENWEA